jgi:putative ABC transport system permease protein
MTLRETIALALRSVARHKLRTFLTTLGVVFGTASVISMVSINEAAKRETLRQIEALGTNNVRIKSVRPPEEKRSERRDWALAYGVTRRDAEHVRAACPDLTTLVPLRDIRSKVFAGDRRLDVNVFGTDADFARAHGLKTREGRFLAALDAADHKRVCVLGAEARRKLFRGRRALGELVNVSRYYFQVVGVLEDRAVAGSGISAAADVNNCVFVPYSACMQRFGGFTVSREPGKVEAVRVEMDELIAVVRDVEAVVPAAAVIRRYFERAHPKRDAEVVVPLELIRQREDARRKFTLVMISIAAISLLVGGIGITNIMLANVVERTKEIGTRRALGARRRDIRRQFLTEAVLLSAVGGAVGIGAGIGLTLLISSAFGWNFVITWLAVGASMAVSGAVGLLSGTYPAVKASRLDPIEALRAE